MAKVAGALSKGDSFGVKPSNLVVVPEENTTRPHKEDYGDIDALAAWIARDGFLQPIVVARHSTPKNGNDEDLLKVIRGNRRALAANRAIELYGSVWPCTTKLPDGTELQLRWNGAVPCVFGSTEELKDPIRHILGNLGENEARQGISPFGRANAYLGLIAHGLTQEEIANRTGRDLTFLRDHLKLTVADPEVRAALRRGGADGLTWAACRQVLRAIPAAAVAALREQKPDSLDAAAKIDYDGKDKSGPAQRSAMQALLGATAEEARAIVNQVKAEAAEASGSEPDGAAAAELEGTEPDAERDDSPRDRSGDKTEKPDRPEKPETRTRSKLDVLAEGVKRRIKGLTLKNGLPRRLGERDKGALAQLQWVDKQLS